MAPYLQKYPLTAGSLFLVYNDLYLGMLAIGMFCIHPISPAQRWTDIQMVDLPISKRAAIQGSKPLPVRIHYFFSPK